MNTVPLAYAFGAGLLATLNPCGFAMLPSLIAFYLGAQDPSYTQVNMRVRVAQVLVVSSLVTAGFLTVFAAGGFLASAGLRFFFSWIPYLTIIIAIGLIAGGVLLLLGRSLPVHLPHLSQPNWRVQRRGAWPMYLYGVSYAVASLSCTLPVFLVVVGSAASQSSPLNSAAMFVTYGGGMALVLLAVTVGAALFHGAVGRWLKTFMPHVQRASAALMIIVGLYLIGFQMHYSFGLG